MRDLIEACGDNNLEEIKSIINSGVDINTKYEDRNNVTVLIVASTIGDLKIVKYLLDNGADINAKDDSNVTALIGASSSGHLEIVQYLVEIEKDEKVDIDAKDNDGWTALMWASRIGNLGMVDCLIKNNAKVNIENKDGQTALDLAKNDKIKELLTEAMRNRKSEINE